MNTLQTNSNGPKWLEVTAEGVAITLSKKAIIQNVTVEKLHLRSPTVKDLRTCQKMHPHDELAVDAMLFSSLAQIGEADLQALTLKDYERVKRGYFRMVEEDEL